MSQSRWRHVVIAAAAVVAAVAPVAVAAPGGDASGLRRVGDVSAPICGQDHLVVDPTSGVLLDLFAADGNCSSNTTKASGTWLQVTDEDSLRVLATLELDLPRPGPITVGKGRHGSHLFAYYTDKSSTGTSVPAVAVYDLTGIRQRTGRLPRLRTIAVPSAITPAPATVSTDDPAEIVSSAGLAGAGMDEPSPADIGYDPASDSIDLLQVYANPNGVRPQASRRGPFANGVYLLEFSASTGALRWEVHLGRCVNALTGQNYAPTLMHVRTPSGPMVTGGCLYNRTVDSGAGTGLQQTQQGALSLPVGGSMMAWLVRLHGTALANPTSPIRYSPGRTGAYGVVADARDHRLFFTTHSPIGSAASTAGAAAVVFDADYARYVGAPTVAPPNEDAYAVTAGGGRYYSIGAHGISVGSATVTPLGQPEPAWPGYHCETLGAVVDPVRRLLFVRAGGGCTATSSGSAHTGLASHLQVFHDGGSLPAPPRPVDPDSYTTQITEQAGVAEASYSGHAAATGSRIRLIGGATGALKGATFNGSDFVDRGLDAVQQEGGPRLAPRDFATHELDAAVVGGVTLSTFDASAQAQAATIDSTTGGDVEDAEQQAGREGWTWPFKEVSCSGQGEPQHNSYGYATGATVTCKQDQQTASGNAIGEALDIFAELAEAPRGAVPAPLGVTWSAGDSTVTRVAESGLMSQATAQARGIVVGPLEIGAVHAAVACRAHGRTGTAGCTYTRTITGVSGGPSGSPTSCSETWTGGRKPARTSCDELIDALNTINPGFLVFSTPPPDTRPNEIAGSPGGYQAVAEREFNSHLEDFVLNYDESTQIPGLRVLYNNDGVDTPSRIDMQFANVQADSHYGITEVGACTTCVDDGAGANDTDTPEDRTGVVPSTDAPSGGDVALPDPPGSSPLLAPLQIAKRVLDGLAWLVRSPGQAVMVLCVLSLLGLPLVLASRRRRLEMLTASPV